MITRCQEQGYLAADQPSPFDLCALDSLHAAELVPLHQGCDSRVWYNTQRVGRVVINKPMGQGGANQPEVLAVQHTTTTVR